MTGEEGRTGPHLPGEESACGRTTAAGTFEGGATTEAIKADRRARLAAARRRLGRAERTAESAAVRETLRSLAPAWAGETVCAYLPVGTEPGSAAGLDLLREAGVRILLPVVTHLGPLDWAEYLGHAALRRGALGLWEPTTPRLGPTAIRTAGLLLIPALAVDVSGVRLGRGGGHYDRSLPFARPDATLAAVVRDEEVIDRLPACPHDVAMTSVLTPSGGLRPLPDPTMSGRRFA